MALAAIALGSNLPGRAGSREANLQGACKALEAFGQVVAVSPWFDTAPVGLQDQPRFLNGATLLRTLLSPHDLLHALLQTEAAFGRDRSQGIDKGPRTLDLDLLFYDDLVLQEQGLVIPHPAMHLRRFVLEPLSAVSPSWVHPILKKTVGELLKSVS